MTLAPATGHVREVSSECGSGKACSFFPLHLSFTRLGGPFPFGLCVPDSYGCVSNPSSVFLIGHQHQQSHQQPGGPSEGEACPAYPCVPWVSRSCQETGLSMVLAWGVLSWESMTLGLQL